MRERLVQFAQASVAILALTLTTSTQAQQPTPRAADPRVQRSGDTQDRSSIATETETIRGVVAAVTAAGEAMIDYRSNRAAAAGAAFLTVVGSPAHSVSGTKDRSATPTNESERSGSSGRKRHNVYIVWLTPQTKICESTAQSDRAAQTPGQSQADKREIALEQLEVGDRVEVQFTRREDSGQSLSVHQNDTMRRTHGRHRTYVGHAPSITILPGMSHDPFRPSGESRSSEHRGRSKARQD
jgi:hypothetical protein